MRDGELHLAARKNDSETTEQLVSAGADVDIRDTVRIQLLIHYSGHLLPRGHLAKLSKQDVREMLENIFSHRVIDRWNALDGETVSSSSINTFKNRLNKIRMTRMGYFMD